MKEMRYGGNIFLLPAGQAGEAAVVTTNGMIRSDGRAVMGAGIAKYVRDNMPGSDEILAGMLRCCGNHAFLLGRLRDGTRASKGIEPYVKVLTMPTKHDWKDPSDLDLIRRSARELTALADKLGLSKIYLPAPGCTNGRLDYASQVRPALAGILDGRFVVCLAPDLYDRLHPAKN